MPICWVNKHRNTLRDRYAHLFDARVCFYSEPNFEAEKRLEKLSLEGKNGLFKVFTNFVQNRHMRVKLKPKRVERNFQ